MKLELRGITKRFPGVVANDNVNLALNTGEVLSLIGENGAGKSTLMSVLYGMYKPDEGEILIDGTPLVFASPADAIAAGIGMVHQHFMLVPVFTVAENVVLGVEPTGAYLDADVKGHITYNSYLSETLADTIVDAHGKADFITFTNVFAHIEDLQAVLRSLKKLMSENTVIVIENHYLGSVLDGNQFDTFYHEHPRTYSYGSFVKMASSLDTQIAGVEFPSRYGGNIRVFLGNSIHADFTGAVDLDALAVRESNFFDDFASLRKNIECWHGIKHKFLQEQFNKHGKLRAKAFPGRAAILVKLLGLDQDLISAVYEKPGSLKIGHYLPGTRIPICSDEDLFSLTDQNLPLLNLAWHIPQEIRNYLTTNGYTGQIIDILSANDFT